MWGNHGDSIWSLFEVCYRRQWKFGPEHLLLRSNRPTRLLCVIFLKLHPKEGPYKKAHIHGPMPHVSCLASWVRQPMQSHPLDSGLSHRQQGSLSHGLAANLLAASPVCLWGLSPIGWCCLSHMYPGGGGDSAGPRTPTTPSPRGPPANS